VYLNPQFLGARLKAKGKFVYINSNFCRVKNLNKIVYLNPKIFGAKLKADDFFTLTPKRFWQSLKLKFNLCTLTPIFCHVKNLNKIVNINHKFLGPGLKLKEFFFTLILFFVT
jgi:hypothetical protein